MPGILPMKVIKVGSTAQSRIAQACDRCRSKKIRCDGMRPSCTQCINVGFECKTSDKLSRRAFPRGYTESLEDRVRSLESEIRELKDLLDEKDEKIDMLSRLHSHSPRSTVNSRGTFSQSPKASSANPDEDSSKDEVFKVPSTQTLVDIGESSSLFVGPSSGRQFLRAFESQAQLMAPSAKGLEFEVFLSSDCGPIGPGRDDDPSPFPSVPPRLVSDQLINIYFQEWAPLFPALHRPSFLVLYEKYVSNPQTVTDNEAIAQLNLIFAIAALSCQSRDNFDAEPFELQWQPALEALLLNNSLGTLQCLVLAQIYCLLKADYLSLLKYKGLSVSMSHRLGLHQSQRQFALDTLSSEKRKKVFWTLYTVDCFSAAHLGLPKMLKDEDIQCEFPVDTDDEYITEKGFQPTLPGESTKLSSALALFRIARVLAKVLSQLYPISATHEISFRTVSALSDELDAWSSDLAPHLRLHFAHDKPATNVTGSRSPLLSMAFHYVRCLINRPLVCANLGDRGSSALLALAKSSKHIVQILELLEERCLSYAFCLNKNEMLILSGFGILFETLNIGEDGRLLKDCRRMACAVVKSLERSSSTFAPEFRRVVVSLFSGGLKERPLSSSRNSFDEAENSASSFRATQQQLKAIASRFGPMCRITKDDSGAEYRHRNLSAVSISSIHSEPSARSEMHNSDLLSSPISYHAQLIRRQAALRRQQNLDYLSFGQNPVEDPTYQLSLANYQEKSEAPCSSADWERLLSSIDSGEANIYDSIYGGQTVDALIDPPHLSNSTLSQLPPLQQTPPNSSTQSLNCRHNNGGSFAWLNELWAMGLDGGSSMQSGESARHPHRDDSTSSRGTKMPPPPQPPQSVLSFSDESLASGGEDFSIPDFVKGDSHPAIVLPDMSPVVEALDDGVWAVD